MPDPTKTPPALGLLVEVDARVMPPLAVTITEVTFAEYLAAERMRRLSDELDVDLSLPLGGAK